MKNVRLNYRQRYTFHVSSTSYVQWIKIRDRLIASQRDREWKSRDQKEEEVEEEEEKKRKKRKGVNRGNAHSRRNAWAKKHAVCRARATRWTTFSAAAPKSARSNEKARSPKETLSLSGQETQGASDGVGQPMRPTAMRVWHVRTASVHLQLLACERTRLFERNTVRARVHAKSANTPSPDALTPFSD